MGGLVLPFHIMAVDNYKEYSPTLYNGGSAKLKDGCGNNTPVADPVFEDDKNYPVGSRYTDLNDGTIYIKTASETWTANSPVA